jgi:catechol 2,3-dioxygenase-like lactoylglutathione lyase family enzyme
MQFISKTEFINMGVKDIDKSKQFYADQLGFKVNVHNQYWLKLELPGGVSLNLANTPDARNVSKDGQWGGFYFGFSTPDVNATLNDLATKGIKPVKAGDDYGKWESASGKGKKYFELEDPDGNRVVVYQQG